ncbi:PRC-barrel domain-containing protein [Cesiribacter andamanensis]|uniref:PRC-barrel domain protein n=1 Tax=Cesiribacter andamanensis AMV16 TaxID=1279009 RepID=M7NKN7_9BACT|nr:PRC-barrel domain-containing protein [Cesiribacter andamanensis]EMR02340.1 PRC-barrel domain protein [Cesiribacter andamanensis AMV16]
MSLQHFANASDLIGKPVHNSLAQEYGKVSDIIVSAAHRRIVALVVEKGGFLGLGADHFVLPWEKVSINPNTLRVLVDADRQTIEGTPLIELDELKDGNYETMALVYSYYGIDTFWEQPADEDPGQQYYTSGDDLGERHPSNEGSYQITNQYPGQRGSKLREETDYDKIKGIKDTDKKQ